MIIKKISSPFGGQHGKQRQIAINLVLFALFFLAFYLSPLTSSLWLDEAITAWIIEADIEEIFARVLKYQAQSPLYFVLVKLWPWHAESELMLRLPSVFFGVAAIVAISLVARELYGKGSGYLAAIISLLGTDVVKISVQARPYALGLFGVSCSMLLLVRWIKSKRQSQLYLHLFLSLIAFYAHYLFGLSAIVYLSLLILLGDKRSLRDYIPVVILGLVLSAPGVYHLYLWSDRAGNSLFTPLPTIGRFLQELVPTKFAIYLFCSAVFAQAFVHKKTTALKPDDDLQHSRIACDQFKRRFIVSAIWGLVAPIALFFLSHITNSSIFVERYMAWRLGGLVLLSLAVGSYFGDKGGKIPFFTAFFILSLYQLTLMRVRNVENWSNVAFIADQNKDLPILLYSGLRESEQVAKDFSPDFRTFLASPLVVYGVDSGRIEIISSDPTDPSIIDYSNSVSGRLKSRSYAINSDFLLVINEQPIFVAGKGMIFPKVKIYEFLTSAGFSCSPIQQSEKEDVFIESSKYSAIKIFFCHAKLT